MSNTKSKTFACMAIVLLSMTAIQATFETKPNHLKVSQPLPTLSSPTDGATNVELSPTFQWNGSLTNATIEIYEGKNFESPRDNLDLENYDPVKTVEINNTMELSGITFANNRLYMITNRPRSQFNTKREIVVSDLEGNVINRIDLSTWQDTEDIAHLGGTRFAIAEEKQGRIYFVDIFPTTSSLNKSSQTFVQLTGNRWPSNDGVEGVAFNPIDNGIYSVTEDLLNVHRFFMPANNDVILDCEPDKAPFNLLDLSAIYHLGLPQGLGNFDVSDHFLLLSHESNKLIETNANCNTIYSQRNLPSNLFSGGEPQFEGVTMDNQGNIYVVSEPNLLYIYTHKNNCHLGKTPTGQIIHSNTLDDTSYNLPISLNPLTEYTWRIVADEGCSEFSSFTTKSDCNISNIETTTTCDDNCTPNDPTDDTFVVTISATVEGGSGSYIVSDGTTTSQPIVSGGSFELGPYATNITADIELTFRDSVDPDCNTTIIVGRIAPCSVSLEGSLTLSVNSDNHDAYETKDGIVNLNSTIIPFGEQIGAGGLIFSNAGIPQGARILSAIIQFTAGANAIEPATLTISAEKNSSAADFNADFPNTITNRPMVSNRVQWEVAPWSAGQSTAAQETPDISDLLQEIVNRGSFGPNSNIGIFITGTGNRTIQTHESGAVSTLTVIYTTCPAAGTSCNDGDPNTVNDTENGECCCEGCPIAGTPCDDGNPDTTNDRYLENCICMGDPIVIVTPIDTVIQIASRDDDVEESGTTGSVALRNNKIQIVSASRRGNQMIGLRFTGINLPSNAKITNAFIEFASRNNKNIDGQLMIYAEDINNSPPFESNSFNVSSREKTMASVAWTPETWEAGVKYQTEDLAPIFEELCNKPDWQEENTAITFIIEGTGRRVARSYDNSPGEAPSLHIQYVIDNTGTQGTDNDSDMR